jgi:hypothetical protein
MHVWCCTDDTDAALLDIFGLAQDEGYAAMGSYMRKYVVFAAAEHTEDFPLLPIFPLQLSSLIRYGWYLQFHGVRGGIHSIRNYLSAITEANSAAGHPDPRAAEPWTWRKFRLNVPKHLLVVDPAKTKLALRVPHMQAVALDADYSRADDLDDLSSYALAWFSAVRVGHFAPKSRSDAHCQHLLRWKHVAFLPSVDAPTSIFIRIESTKTRAAKKVDPWWTAIGLNEVFPQFCAVRLLLAHYHATFNGDPEAHIWVDASGAPRLRNAFTARLRLRLLAAAPRLGMTAAEMNVMGFAPISFRKGQLSALAKELRPVMLAKVGDHDNVKTTNKYYVTDTVEERAANTVASARAFAPL